MRLHDEQEQARSFFDMFMQMMMMGRVPGMGGMPGMGGRGPPGMPPGMSFRMGPNGPEFYCDTRPPGRPKGGNSFQDEYEDYEYEEYYDYYE